MRPRCSLAMAAERCAFDARWLVRAVRCDDMVRGARCAKCLMCFMLFLFFNVCSFVSGDGPEEWKLKGMFVDLG